MLGASVGTKVSFKALAGERRAGLSMVGDPVSIDFGVGAVDGAVTDGLVEG